MKKKRVAMRETNFLTGGLTENLTFAQTYIVIFYVYYYFFSVDSTFIFITY